MAAHNFNRREFIKTTSGVIAGAAALGLPPICLAQEVAATPQPESLVKTLYESLSPKQREAICFDWNFVDPKRELLRTRVANNWDITDHYVSSDFYTKDQQAMVRQIFEGIIQPQWHERIDQQLDDDSGGFGESNSIAIFGQPGSDQFEFVLTGRHMTLRADGNTTDHVAFGGPIFYGHAADGFDEGPDHKGNVFWPQAKAANSVYEMLDDEQRDVALVRQGLPPESRVGFQGAKGKFQGIQVGQLHADQQQRVQDVLKTLIEPYRSSDQDEVIKCLKAQGGLSACHLAFYAQGDIGDDKVWDNWRLEGPSFVWHFRGSPHVHVWVNVADDPGVKLNAG